MTDQTPVIYVSRMAVKSIGQWIDATQATFMAQHQHVAAALVELRLLRHDE